LILSGISERAFFFIVFLLIAREYPTEIYGELVTVFSIANIFIILFDLGLPILLQREISVSKADSPEFFSNVFGISLLTFPVYFITTLVYCHYFFSNISYGLTFVTVCAVYVFSISNLLTRTLIALNDFKNQFIPLLLSRSFILILVLPAVYFFKINLTFLLFILLSGALMQAALLIKNIKSNNLYLSFTKINFSKIKSVIRLSFPLGLAVLFNFLYDKIDIVLISKLTDFNETAYYNVGYGIFKASAVTYTFLFSSGLTRISYISRNKKAVRLFFKKYSLMLIYISLLLTLLLFFGAGIIINLIYTSKFNHSVLVLQILSFAAIGLSLNNLTGVILNGLALYKKNMIVTLIGLIINVILNLIFIPEYGIIAAAIVTVITEYFIFFGDYFFIGIFLKE
jgi:O-antigen/teichoic acid export membrane protein